MAEEAFHLSPTSNSSRIESLLAASPSLDLVDAIKALQEMSVACDNHPSTGSEVQGAEEQKGSERIMQHNLAGQGKATCEEDSVMDITDENGRIGMGGSETAETSNQMRSLGAADAAEVQLSPEEEAQFAELLESTSTNISPEFQRALKIFAFAVEGWSPEAIKAEFEKVFQWDKENPNV